MSFRTGLRTVVFLTAVLPVSLAGAQDSDGNALTTKPSPASAKSTSDKINAASTGHLEVPDDAYIHVPGRGRATSPAVRWARGGYVSVQVNVNALGHNMFGDAANEPSIAVDPTNPNKMAIGWRQFDTVSSNFRQAGWGYTTDGGQSWTFPGVIEPGVFRSDPVLAADADGNFYYNSLTADEFLSNFWCHVYKSTDGGATWDSGTYAYGGDKQWMVIDQTDGIGRNNIYAYWTRYASSCDGNFTRSYDQAESFVGCPTVPGTPKWGTLAVGPDGELYVAGDGFIVAKSTTMQDESLPPEWDFSTTVNLDGSMGYSGGPNPGGLLGQVWIAVDHSDGLTRGNVYLLCSVHRSSAADPLDVMFARSTNGGTSWSPPVRVNDDPPDNGAYQWFGTMSVAPNGRIDVIWNDTRNDPGGHDSELYYSFSVDGGVTWSPNEALSPPFDPHLGYPNQNKLGDYYDMVSDNGGAAVAYAATFNFEQDVYFLRIDLDCNDNGVTDDLDVANGTSEDCNGNNIPDECEPDEDCNNNEVQDICDIAAGTSPDCNLNRVPDECEPDEDCNGNGIQDICDIAFGTSADCNQNSTPDECEPDCNGNGVPDDCDVASGARTDCNDNGAPDDCDVADGTSADCNENNFPDECDLFACGPPSDGCPGEGDCCYASDTPGCDCAVCCRAVCLIDPFCCDALWDGRCAREAALFPECYCFGPGPSQSDDCNTNGVPDECDIADGTSADCNANVIPDECEPDEDCNGNGVQDICDLAAGTSEDCNQNLLPDECESDEDCNGNGVQDFCDLAAGTSDDCSHNGIPDECEPDCNDNGWADVCDLMFCGPAVGDCPGKGDCCDPAGNGTPGCDCASCCIAICALDWECCHYGWDEVCAVLAAMEPDCYCDGEPGSPSEDCNDNDVPDECDTADGTSPDVDSNGIPDECEVVLPGQSAAQPANRYVAFRPNNGIYSVAFQIEITEGPGLAGTLGWVSGPIEMGCPDQCNGLMVARIVDDPVYRIWDEPDVFIADCGIAPGSRYALRTTADASFFSDPLEIHTVSIPDKAWADVVGEKFLTFWWPPNGIVNFDDIQAAIQTFEDVEDAPPDYWIDIADEVPDLVVNMTDVQMIILAFEGGPYPYSEPMSCP